VHDPITRALHLQLDPPPKDILVHPNQRRYPGQVVLVVAYRDYIFLVPSVEEKTHYFLKTIIPSRKATRDYLRNGENDEGDEES
jgi:hypothetical protein